MKVSTKPKENKNGIGESNSDNERYLMLKEGIGAFPFAELAAPNFGLSPLIGFTELLTQSETRLGLERSSLCHIQNMRLPTLQRTKHNRINSERIILYNIIYKSFVLDLVTEGIEEFGEEEEAERQSGELPVLSPSLIELAASIRSQCLGKARHLNTQ